MNNEILSHEYYIRECIQLSRQAIERGDGPFGALVAGEQGIIARGINNALSKTYEHAELIALHEASLVLGTRNLEGYTLYTSCEPCPMCAFMLREYHISRLVYAISSPGMGGVTKWNIAGDRGLNHFKPFFGEVPEIIPNILEEEALQALEGTPHIDYLGSEK